MAAPLPSPTTKWHTTSYPSISPTRPELSAKGKTVLITGAGTGIGAEIARHFAQAGASRIALLGRREQPLRDTKASIEKINPNVDVFFASTDVTSKEQVNAAFDRFVGDSSDKPGKIDILVSNAAVAGPLEPISSVDSESFLDAIMTNLRGSLHVAQAFLRHAVPKDAVVIEINSSAAHLDFAPALVSYNVAKMAVYRMWDALRFEFMAKGMKVYHVQPGVVNTDMNKAVGGVEAIGYEDHVSLPASFSVWLASPEARFLNGKFVWANWDVDELKARAKEIETGQDFNVQVVGWPFGEKWEPDFTFSAPA